MYLPRFTIYEAIKSIDNTEHLTSKIRGLIKNHFQKIKVLWVPSHVDNPGNEFADEAN